MRSLFRYLIKNHAFLLFLALEVISFVFIFNFNNYQKTKYLNSANYVSASIYNSYNSVLNYFELASINQKLAQENARLRASRLLPQKDADKIQNLIAPLELIPDSTFQYTSARVINNSVIRPFNYITLNKGSKHGIKPDQGVLSGGGVVGVITNVTDSYSLALSVLNQRWSVSAKLKNSGFFGPLTWKGDNYRLAELQEIPFHVRLNRGDSIVTSGYSAIFPEGILIGTVHSFTQPEGDNYYNIKVQLSTDFKSLSYVEIIENLNKPEIQTLEESIQDGAVSN